MAVNNQTPARHVSLERKGRVQELQLEQVTVDNLRRIFQVS